MTVLLLKLTLSPMIIAAASLLTRRFGPVVGGWLIGLPVTAGPVALFLALEHGAGFTARVSTGFVAGVSGQAAFVLGYVALARRGATWLTALLGGTAAFTITGVALVEAGLTLPVLLVCALTILIVGLRLLPPAAVVEQPPQARRDVVVRMVAATFFVLTITTFASQLGPGLSGVATTFPLLSTILAVSMHHRRSPGAAIAVYRGLMTGLFALTAFAATLAAVLSRLPISEAFALAIVLTLSIQLGSFRTLQRSRAGLRA